MTHHSMTRSHWVRSPVICVLVCVGGGVNQVTPLLFGVNVVVAQNTGAQVTFGTRRPRGTGARVVVRGVGCVSAGERRE